MQGRNDGRREGGRERKRESLGLNKEGTVCALHDIPEQIVSFTASQQDGRVWKTQSAQMFLFYNLRI